MSAPPPPRGGMSLYANLLASNADSSASLSRPPVAFNEASKDDAAAKKAAESALRFQPIRRPQVPTKTKTKTSFPKAVPTPVPAAVASATAPAAATAPTAGPGAANTQQRSTLADWTATEEDEYLYSASTARQRGGRRKKNKRKWNDQPEETNWDELYDPSRPTNVEEYLRSDEKIREVREWKAVLYAHRRKRRPSNDSEIMSDESEERTRPTMNNQFAPPSSHAFAPPPMSPPRPAEVPDDATGDDAYARRLALSGVPAPPPQSSASPPPPPPPPPADNAPHPPADDGVTISRAPVRYEQPPPPPDQPPAPEHMDVDDDDDDDEDDTVDYSSIGLPPPAEGEEDPDGPRSSRPGQAGFAKRLMAKYGWTRGSGLGVDESGITSALRVQVEKRRKRPDAEGGGYAEPGGRGKILGGQRKGEGNGGGTFGRMSEVVVLGGMLENMPDLQREVEEGELVQEIGEECGSKYGRVERLYIDVDGRQVFIKFTDQVSALRAVNALDGRIFNGNSIAPRFYDSDAFDKGIYK